MMPLSTSIIRGQPSNLAKMCIFLLPCNDDYKVEEIGCIALYNLSYLFDEII